MRRVVVLAEAASDIEEARDFYDRQEPGIGDYCDSLVADIESLSINHGIHFRQFGVYRMLAERFPFGIYFGPASRPQLDPARTFLAWLD